MTVNTRSSSLLVRGLGLASAALGVPMLARTDDVAELVGVDDSPLSRPVIRAVGVRELVAALLLLTGPKRSVWFRVAGDAVDLAVLGTARTNRSGERERRVTAATAAVVGLTVMDLYAALRARRDQHGPGRPGPLQLQASVTVNKSPDETFAFWRDLTNLPRFMQHLESVTPTAGSANRSHWVAKAPFGTSVSWDAEITSEEPGRRLAWRSLPGSRIDNSGTVHFAEAPGDRGTEVKVVLHYDVPGGRLGRAVAKLFGEDPVQQVRDDLRRFKQVMETGDIVRSDGLPGGTHAKKQAVQRPAQPLGRPVQQLEKESTK
jgi:uncharacterized membrane protein